MYHFCTYFDQGYLSRGLALYRSLDRHCPAFRLWALCMDEASYAALAQLQLPHIELIALAELERYDPALLAVKVNRSRIEYYFTCTPSLPLYVLQNWSEVDLITYLDADLYFFSDPAPVFAEIGPASIAVIEHRFPPRLRYLEQWGRFNVGWVSFRRDASGLACLQWWRERCIEWCYDRREPTRFADQKYLDEWPDRFSGLAVIQHKGANLAPWNAVNYTVHIDDTTVWVDADPLIFYHVHGLRHVPGWFYDHRFSVYYSQPAGPVLRHIYAPYIRDLVAAGQDLPVAISSRHAGLSSRVGGFGRLFDLGLGLLKRRYIVEWRGELFYFDGPLRPVSLGPVRSS